METLFLVFVTMTLLTVFLSFQEREINSLTITADYGFPSWIGGNSVVVADNLYAFQGASYSNACFNLSVDNNFSYLLHNAYYGSGWKQRLTGYAPTMLQTGSAAFNFNYAADTGSDASISWIGLMALNSSGAIFNEAGNAGQDFRVESDTNSHMLFVDAGNGRVNVAGDGPGVAALNVRGSLAISNSGGAQSILMGNQDSAGANKPFVLTSANAALYVGVGDNWASSTGGTRTDIAYFDTTQIVFNEGSRDQDFRVESDNDAHALFVDGLTGNVYGSKTGSSMTTAGWGLARNGGSEFVSQGNNICPLKVASADDAYIALAEFYTAGGTQAGYLLGNGNALSLVSISDYRLKENVVDLTGATERLKQLPVHRYNFINNPDETLDGFLAHELKEILPQAAHGTKDEVDADGNPVYQGIDQSQLVPLLVRAIQELEARIAALES